MALSRMFGVCALTALMGLAGCSGNTKDENALLKKENGDLRTQLSERNTALESANTELRDRNMQIAQLRRDMEGGGGTTGGTTGFEGIEGVQGSAGAGEVTASVESDLLFDSGKTSLKASAKKSLDAVAGVLKGTYGSNEVRIAGHTDADPIKKSGFKSNHHLAFERAVAVRDYLVSKGVEASRVYLASFGPDKPMGSKPQSRRVEIVVVLNDNGLE